MPGTKECGFLSTYEVKEGNRNECLVMYAIEKELLVGSFG